MYKKVLLLAVFAASTVGAVAIAQQTQDNTTGASETADIAIVGQDLGSSITISSGQDNRFGLFGDENNPEFARNREIQKQIKEATAKLRSAENNSDRAAAQTELKTALGEDYDARLEDYEKELDRMEKQLAEMREKLARRRRAKEDMVELRMQVLEAEADDLGWPSRTSSSPFALRGSSGPAVWSTGRTQLNRSSASGPSSLGTGNRNPLNKK